MPPNPPSDDGTDEIEIRLDNGAELHLHNADVDADGRPIEFSVDGVIRDVDSEIFDQLEGETLEPIAVRFKRVTATG